MNSNLEIERKFLVGFPDIGLLNVSEKLDMVQTYLKDGTDGSQRRVRRITVNGNSSYIYTEKIFYSAVTRKETEYEISSDEYARLLCEKKEDLVPIIKTRYKFDYLDQCFELDTYPFSDKLAILELELSSPEQEIFFPDTISIIKEVTGIDEYSNSALGNANAFPDEAAKGDI